MSAQQLSDACMELGLPIARSVLANFESGRRPTLSVAELLVLAKALGAPPATLLFPPGRSELVEVLPGRELRAWDALQWCAGEKPLMRSRLEGHHYVLEVEKEDVDDWNRDVSGVRSYRWHEQYVEQWLQAMGKAAAARKAAGAPDISDGEREVQLHLAESHEQRAAMYEQPLADERRRLRDFGLALPDLPPRLSKVDAPDRAFDRRWLHE